MLQNKNYYEGNHGIILVNYLDVDEIKKFYIVITIMFESICKNVKSSEASRNNK